VVLTGVSLIKIKRGTRAARFAGLYVPESKEIQQKHITFFVLYPLFLKVSPF
jgi:hypothetical protein